MILIEMQGRVLQYTRPHEKPSPPPPSNKRGKITIFSKRSRARLIDLMMRLDVSHVKVVFLTLTFHGIPSPSEAKKAFKRFTMRLRRAYPEASAVWRVERQKRGSIHFHLLIFNVPYWPHAALQKVWTQCTGEDLSIVWIEQVKSHKQVMHYVSKKIGYVGKAEKELHSKESHISTQPPEHPIGRIWGYINKDGLPLGEVFSLVTEDENLASYLQFAIRTLSKGYSGEWRYNGKLYSSEGQAIYDFALLHGAYTPGAYVHRKTHGYTVDNSSAVPPRRGGTGVLLACHPRGWCFNPHAERFPETPQVSGLPAGEAAYHNSALMPLTLNAKLR